MAALIESLTSEQRTRIDRQLRANHQPKLRLASTFGELQLSLMGRRTVK